MIFNYLILQTDGGSSERSVEAPDQTCAEAFLRLCFTTTKWKGSQLVLRDFTPRS